MKPPSTPTARYDIRPIVGIEQPTAQSAQRDGNKVKLLRRLGKDDLAGDGTVPRPSATPTEFDRLQNAIYASERHASLQNDGDVLFQLNGILTQPSFNPSDYRDATSKIGQSLDVEDWLTPDQPLEVRARPHADPGGLLVAAEDAETGEEKVRQQLQPTGDGWYTATLGPLPEGLYRVSSLAGRGAGDGSRHGRRRVAHGELGCSHRYRPVLVGRPTCVEPSATRSRCGNGSSTRLAATCRPRTSSSCSPADHSPEVDEGLAPTLATKANIILAINNLMDLSGGKGERLYFFFAGHGLTTRVSNRDERASRRDFEHKHRPLDRAALALGVLRRVR